MSTNISEVCFDITSPWRVNLIEVGVSVSQYFTSYRQIEALSVGVFHGNAFCFVVFLRN